MIAFKCTWRERRGDGWSETLYQGLVVESGGTKFIVADLSHGLRVMLLNYPPKYQFISEEPTTVTAEFVVEMVKFYLADRHFQSQRGAFNKSMS